MSEKVFSKYIIYLYLFEIKARLCLCCASCTVNELIRLLLIRHSGDLQRGPCSCWHLPRHPEPPWPGTCTLPRRQAIQLHQPAHHLLHVSNLRKRYWYSTSAHCSLTFFTIVHSVFLSTGQCIQCGMLLVCFGFSTNTFLA